MDQALHGARLASMADGIVEPECSTSEFPAEAVQARLSLGVVICSIGRLHLIPCWLLGYSLRLSTCARAHMWVNHTAAAGCMECKSYPAYLKALLIMQRDVDVKAAAVSTVKPVRGLKSEKSTCRKGSPQGHFWLGCRLAGLLHEVLVLPGVDEGLVRVL